ncbi:armadillo repeat-containing protein 4-like [Durio zibethinus]|uniref:Armadillo repeat-containing protein 4-like n=1 Tax=Durio zibethinus TaxID=66656 RepID=A0A6P5ZLX8_DURZI|nr:armadillo repeat-containing protein 4-like [Durio zibethinus]XP_022753909.1 armadillo repeat-containing protein 4-like [Durio zibethinus]
MNPNWEEALNHLEMVIDSGPEAMRIKAIFKLAQLSNHAPVSILGSAVPILANLIADHSSNNSSLYLQGVVVYCLKCIARQGDGRLATEIGQSGALLSILRLLPESGGSFQRVAVKCLWCLVNLCDDNRVIVAMNGGLEIIVNMLNSSMGSVRRYLLEILSALSLLRVVRRGLVGLDGLRFLVEAASFGNMLSRERACQAIGLLGVTRRARRMLVDLGVIPVLVELLRVGDSGTKLVAGNSLGVISAHIDYIGPVAQAGAIPLFAELIQGPEPLGQEVAEDAFCLLAVAEANAVSIAEHLVRILREGNDEAKAAAANVFWDLSGYKHSVSVVRNSGAIPLLVELLGSQSSEVRETVSGAIAQLSYNGADQEALIESGAVPLLLELLNADSEELRDNAAEALINFNEDPLQHERISQVVDHPSFRSMQDRLTRIRASDNQTVRSMRQMTIEQLDREA